MSNYDNLLVETEYDSDETSLFNTMSQLNQCKTIGSMDATHVKLERVASSRHQSHLARKLHATARSYNVVVNHRRRILGTTNGHPARCNDKSETL